MKTPAKVDIGKHASGFYRFLTSPKIILNGSHGSPCNLYALGMMTIITAILFY